MNEPFNTRVLATATWALHSHPGRLLVGYTGTSEKPDMWPANAEQHGVHDLGRAAAAQPSLAHAMGCPAVLLHGLKRCSTLATGCQHQTTINLLVEHLAPRSPWLTGEGEHLRPQCDHIGSRSSAASLDALCVCLSRCHMLWLNIVNTSWWLEVASTTTAAVLA